MMKKPRLYQFLPCLALLPFLFVAMNNSFDDNETLAKPALTPQIEAIAPMGEFTWKPGNSLEFVWTSLDGYSGAYTLKVIEIHIDSMLPDSLPNTGLFFTETNISDTSFSYPVGAPDFLEDHKYAWQIETVGLPNGQRERGPVVGIFVLPPCVITATGMPPAQICPDDCFTINGTWPNSLFSFGSKRLYVFTNHPDPTTVEVDGTPAYDLSSYAPGLNSMSPHFSNNSLNYSVEICIQAGAPTPFDIKLFYYKPSFSCSLNTFGSSCCHDDIDFTVDVADVENYSDLNLMLQNPATQADLTEICNGDPVYFYMGNPMPGDASILWEYADNGGLWTPITNPDFNNFTFSIPPYPLANELWFDCSVSNDGFVDRKFRATVNSTNGNGDLCVYRSNEYEVRICCPITNASVQVLPDDPLCEGDVVTLTATLTSTDPFVAPPGSEVDIEWFRDNVNIGQTDQASVTETITVGIVDICFRAEITNCAGKQFTATKCIKVDPKPMCGEIAGISAELMLVSTDPITMDRVYEICNGEDAIIGIITPFTNCVKHWQYSDDGVFFTEVPLGVSNDQQNTNTLFNPLYNPVYYRVECRPYDYPDSGCAPCYSNIIKIQEKAVPATPVLVGDADICSGESTLITVSNPDPNLNYTWLCNGLEVGTSTSLTADEEACYWVVGTDGCYEVESPKFCLTVCEVIPIITCPLVPNECASLGVPIEISASDSESSCMGTLQYTWSWDNGTLVADNGTTLEHIPNIAGTTYTLTVTDLGSGCSATTMKTIIPCDKN
jgi:hypothetical protein